MFIIIADDLTGATDTGIQFQKRGIATSVLVEPPSENISYLNATAKQALSINASSRELPSSDAKVRTQTVLNHITVHDSDILFKKVDSLMRGNPVEELETMLQFTDRKIALVAPSFPEMGRIVNDGFLHLPDGSVKDLVTLFKSHTQISVCYISLARLRTEWTNLANIFSQETTPQIYIFDTATEKDLSLVAKIGQALTHPPVYCGCAALAAALSSDAQMLYPTYHPHAKKVLVVTGSRKLKTAQQIQYLKETCNLHMVLMNSKSILHDPNSNEVLSATQQLTELLQQEPGAILAFDSLFYDQTGFENDEISVRQDGKRLASKLGEVLYNLNPNLYDGLILIGGDTSVEICHSLGVTQIQLLEEIQTGIPSGLLADGPLCRLPIVTKSGAFGDKRTLLLMWEYIRNNIL